MFPLTAKQAKSMLAMQRAQPEIKKLQAKFKNDRQKLNEEMMKFYKENEINPLGGCLPLLVQMPIFIALYQTLINIQKFNRARALGVGRHRPGAWRRSSVRALWMGHGRRVHLRSPCPIVARTRRGQRLESRERGRWRCAADHIGEPRRPIRWTAGSRHRR
jgi:YidC/Oxa1 family membrane protein insertase